MSKQPIKDYVNAYRKTKKGARVRTITNIRRYEPGFTISEEDWDTHWNATSCFVCSSDLPVGTDTRKHYDHEHGSSLYRGTLCSKCNQALGLLGDNIETITKLIQYLEAQ